MKSRERKIAASIAEELLAMAKLDQKMRAETLADQSTWDNDLDHQNTERLKEIVVEIGWPAISKVGPEASNAAWLLVQHAAHDSEFMKKCLDLMKAAGEGEVLPANVAFLEDRVLAFSGNPQIYGTQFRLVNGKLEPFPIDDPDNLNQRRAEVGLGPFSRHSLD